MFYFTTTNAIMVKLATDIYLNEVFHWQNFGAEFITCRRAMHKNFCRKIFGLILTISDFDHWLFILHIITVQKTTQEQPKMTVYAGKKTFKNLKPENYRYDISQKLVRFVYDLNTFHFYWKQRVLLEGRQTAHPKKSSKNARNLSRSRF